MNASITRADSATHVKIVATALFCSAVVALIAAVLH